LSILLSQITLPEHALRSDYGNVEELAESIKTKGLIYPILIRPLLPGNTHKTVKYEVIAGCRRFKAFQTLARKELSANECFIREVDDKTAFELSLIENLQKQSMSPQEEAKAFKTYLMEAKYGTQAELGKAINKSQVFISQRLDLLKLPDSLLEKAGVFIPLKIAEELAKGTKDIATAKLEEIANEYEAHKDDMRKIEGTTPQNIVKSMVQDQIAHPDKDVPRTFLDVSTKLANGTIVQEDDDPYRHPDSPPKDPKDPRLENAEIIKSLVQSCLYQLDTYIRDYDYNAEDRKVTWTKPEDQEFHQKYVKDVRLLVLDALTNAMKMVKEIKKYVA